MSRKPLVGRPLSIIMSAEDNIARYLKQPSIALVNRVMVYMGINKQMFELLFGIPAGMLRQYTGGFRKKLPAKYWHLFFEMKQIKKMVRHKIMYLPGSQIAEPPKVATKEKKEVSHSNVDILNKFKTQLSQNGR